MTKIISNYAMISSVCLPERFNIIRMHCPYGADHPDSSEFHQVTILGPERFYKKLALFILLLRLPMKVSLATLIWFNYVFASIIFRIIILFSKSYNYSLRVNQRRLQGYYIVIPLIIQP
jgi:hypothetical protein